MTREMGLNARRPFANDDINTSPEHNPILLHTLPQDQLRSPLHITVHRACD